MRPSISQENQLNVGPGQYEWDKSKKFDLSVKFGSGIREELKHINSTKVIGPGQYDVGLYNMSNGKGKGWSMTGRNNKSYTNLNPGPGQYDWDKLKRNVGNRHALGMDSREPMGKNNGVPGPEAYSDVRDFKTLPKFSMGKEPRKRNISLGMDSPGPAGYDTTGEIGVGTGPGGGGWSFGRNPRGVYYDKITTTPGFYDFRASIPDVPGYLVPKKNKNR